MYKFQVEFRYPHTRRRAVLIELQPIETVSEKWHRKNGRMRMQPQPNEINT